MQIDLSQFRQLYLQESTEHLEGMEASLLKLRIETENADLLHSVFRAAHSIKGGAGSFGLIEVVRFTHRLEELLDRLRAFEIPVTDDLIDLLLESVDTLRIYFHSGAEGNLTEAAEGVLDRLLSFTATATKSSPAQVIQALEATPETNGLHTFRIHFRPAPDIFSNGTNPILLLRNLRDLGEVTHCEIETQKLPSLTELDPAQCYLSWNIELKTSGSEEEIHEIFEFVEDQAEILIEPLVRALTSPARPAEKEYGKLQEPQKVALHESGNTTRKLTKSSTESGSIRVATEKIDRLIDLVGELTIAHSMTTQMVDNFTPQNLPLLREAMASLERHTRELHERAMSVRMLPIGSLFQRYSRTVHDISRITGKQIKLEIRGEDTEVDKSILEQLGDPLTHLIRNAADHGIESPEERTEMGKPADGTISLCAFHQGGKVILEVSDDGRGMNIEKIRQKAIHCGLISSDAQCSEDQLRLLIFEPGFSTCDQVSDISGRGVGMDVVRKNVQALNGTISIDSQQGKGSTIRISLPLTLAVLEGLLVRVADRTLVLPLLSVIESVSPHPEQIVSLAGQGEVVILREEPIPLLRMKKYLGVLETAAANKAERNFEQIRNTEVNSTGQRNLVVVMEHGSRKIALAVDELLGQQQVVIKSLDRHFHKVDGLMGATILGDGCVAPIMDVGGLATSSLFALRPGEINTQAVPCCKEIGCS